MNEKGKLYGIGIGPGDPDLITLKAVQALNKADLIYVPKSKEQASTALNIVQKHLSDKATIVHLEFPMSRDASVRQASRKQNAEIIKDELDKGKTVAFLTLGDPMLYSTYSYVLGYLVDSYHVETIPGIYSFSAMSSMLNRPLCVGDQSVGVISAMGDNEMAILDAADTVICMKVSAYYEKLYNFLKQNDGYIFTIVSNVGKPGQQVGHSLEVLTEKVPYFSTVILHKNTK